MSVVDNMFVHYCVLQYNQLSQHLFLFDQSSNHQAVPADGLLAHRLNGGDVKPGSTRDGWFVGPGGEVVVQSMVYGENHIDETKRGTKQGLKTNLLERDLWKEGLRKSCGNQMRRTCAVLFMSLRISKTSEPRI
ncbi:hypothetical protein V1508DRAFT_68613 [Lipomyces doorenjongii]|uniref:uncharacterized protein n=1 Tax=Lipomyces doorenjongii TaxID=383834 RepID=UPI0034CDE6BD